MVGANCVEFQPEVWEVWRVSEIEIEVESEAAGERLDVFLARRVPGMSRARAKEMIEAGDVRVGSRGVRKSYLVREGDRVALLRRPERVDFHAAADPELEIEVLYESQDFVVVDKRAGVPSHPLREGELGTLAGALVARYPEMRGVGYRNREPGIIHRLDTGTSGVMLAARNRPAFDELRRKLRSGEIEKRYLARCVGAVSAPQLIDTPLATDPRDRRKVRACKDPREITRLGAQPAVTEVLASEQAAQGSLVEVRANHARRHQVRAHLASIGHPLLGDPLYGGPPGPEHHLLHASYLRIGSLPPILSTWGHLERYP